MIRGVRLLALVALATLVLMSCAKLGSGGATNAIPADIYSVIPSVADVRALLGDSNWWVSPPSFEVSPLNSQSAPLNERFAVSQYYLHIGTAEQLFVRYTVYDSTTSATKRMTDVGNALGASPSNPKVGDQVLYYGAQGSSAAPMATRTFVRVGQILLAISWTRKDAMPTVQQLGKIASKFSVGLKNAGKTHASAHPVDAKLLPPPNLQVTLLGSAQLPVESFVVLFLASIPDQIVALLSQLGVTNFAYGDFALNNDTHMEVQTGLLTFGSASDASGWASTFSQGTPDANGISNAYIPIAGSPAAGVYHYLFASGSYGVLLVCRSSVDGEAATRECEDPMAATALAWKLALGGLR